MTDQTAIADDEVVGYVYTGEHIHSTDTTKATSPLTTPLQLGQWYRVDF